MADNASCCQGFPNAGQCWNNQAVAPPNYPASGQWYQQWDFGTPENPNNPPVIRWVNDAGEEYEPGPEPQQSVMRKKRRPVPKRPKKPGKRKPSN